MKIASIAGNIVLTLLLFFSLLLMARQGFAQELGFSDGKVDVVYPAEKSAPYKLRRGAWSNVLGFNFESITPDKYISPLETLTPDGTNSYKSLFGTSPIQMFNLELGRKYNFALGSLGLSAVAGGGGVIDGRSADNRRLALVKKGVSANLTLDTLFNEPYVAPYASVHVFSFDWSETAEISQERKSGSTAVTTGLVAGALIQLNWIDGDGALAAQDSFGLENTYLDLFVSQYNTSDSKKDPNFKTGTNYGAGLKMEF